MDVLEIRINGRFLTQALTGVQRYARETLGALDRLVGARAPEVAHMRFEVLVPRGEWQLPVLANIPIRRVGVLAGHAWEQLELPWFTGNQLLLNLCNTGPLALRRQVVTIHDAAVFDLPQTFSRAFSLWYRFLLPRLWRRARGLATVSRFSRERLEHHLGPAGQVLAVAGEGVEHVTAVPPDRGVLARHDLQKRPFLLLIGATNPRKNFDAAQRATELLQGDFDVVVAGDCAPLVFAGGQRASDGPRVRRIGRVSDGELRALYEAASCFLYPSLYEGFGLPPLEAMLCGCPVVAARAGSLPEVCADAALYCDPHSPSDIASAVERLMADATLRAQLRSRGLTRARQLTWRRGALDVVGLLERTAKA